MLWSGQQIVTPSSSAEPISLAEVRAHCRVDADDQDAYLADLIAVARETIEGITGRMMQQQTWAAYFQEWGDFIVPKPPLVSLTHVKYYPADGSAAVTVSPSTYQVVLTREPAVVALGYNKSWPTAEMRTVDPIELQFVCGYTSVPRRLKHAMKLLVGHWFSKREAVIVGNSVTIESKEVALTVTHLCGDYVARYPL